MKNLVLSAILCTAALGLAACETMGNVETAAPYELERTAIDTGDAKMAPAPQPAPVPECPPAPEPVVQQCDTTSWENRVKALEAELAQCREASARIRSEFRDDLRK